MRRDFDAVRINRVVNHPEVKRWISQTNDVIDLTPMVTNPRNILLMSDGGGTLFVNHAPALYELHTQFLPDGRRLAFRFVREALRWMFLRSDAMELMTRVPIVNEAAVRFTEAFGPIMQHEGPGNGPFGPCAVRIYRMTWWDWLKTVKWPPVEGFPDDANALAALACIAEGGIDKGVVLFNRWASVAGYAPIDLHHNAHAAACAAATLESGACLSQSQQQS